MKRKTIAVGIVLLVLFALPLAASAAYSPPGSYGAPENVGVSFDYSAPDAWNFYVGYAASQEMRDLVQAEADGSFDEAGFANLGTSVEVDFKLDDGQWRSVTVESEELSYGVWFNAEEGKYTDQTELRFYEFESLFTDGVLPGGDSYFNSHTMNFRVRFCVYFGDENEDYEYYSPWSAVASYTNGVVEDPAELINHAPVLKSAEVRKYDNGEPYLYLTADKPHADILKLNSISNQEVHTNVWLKVGTGDWKDNGTYGVGLEGFEVDGDDYFRSFTDGFDAAVYDVKFRYEFDYDNYPAAGKTGFIYSPFSNVISQGMPAYSNASSWAKAELDKGAQYGFITDRIKNQMNREITREEFCEIVVKMVEKLTGWSLLYSQNPFSDTTNPEILKAYSNDIVEGIGDGKFGPNNLITRQEMAVMMQRAIKTSGMETNFSVSDVAKFKDEASIASWASDAVRFMYKNGILKGSGDGKIDPRGNTTREQAVLIIVRAYEKYAQ